MDDNCECLAWVNLRFQCLALASKDNAGNGTEAILKAADKYMDFIFANEPNEDETETENTKERTN